MEAFESLEPFHRELEEFYAALNRENASNLYYERRSKQYEKLRIDKTRIVSLATQCKAFMSMFLDEPHSWPRYYGEILRVYRNRMFHTSHRLYPYYTSALALVNVEALLRARHLPWWYRKYRHQLLMLLRVSIGGRAAPALGSKKMDGYCEQICEVLGNTESFREHVEKAASTLNRSLQSFEGNRNLAMRLRSFTSHLVPNLGARPFGIVKFYDIDRGFGFIVSEQCVKDVFVHVSSIKGTVDRYLHEGQQVEFDLVETAKGFQAENVDIVEMA